MPDTPSDRRYLESHEWHKPVSDGVIIGITQFAADELTDITFVDIKKKPGDKLAAGDRFGEIESVKATSDLYTGIAGTVVEANPELSGSPGLVNTDPYDKGWMIKIKPDNPADVEKLLSVSDYLKKTGH
jgi:glycine cleavage system H protein